MSSGGYTRCLGSVRYSVADLEGVLRVPWNPPFSKQNLGLDDNHVTCGPSFAVSVRRPRSVYSVCSYATCHGKYTTSVRKSVKSGQVYAMNLP